MMARGRDRGTRRTVRVIGRAGLLVGCRFSERGRAGIQVGDAARGETTSATHMDLPVAETGRAEQPEGCAGTRFSGMHDESVLRVVRSRARGLVGVEPSGARWVRRCAVVCCLSWSSRPNGAPADACPDHLVAPSSPSFRPGCAADVWADAPPLQPATLWLLPMACGAVSWCPSACQVSIVAGSASRFHLCSRS